MKKRYLVRGIVAASVAWAAAATLASGQGFGVGGGTSNTDGFGGKTGVEFGPPKRTEPETIRISLTVVGEPREWTNTEGKKIVAALVAFPKSVEAEEPADGVKNTGVEILKDGKVRFLQGNDYTKVAEYPVEKLSEADQEYISNLALNIRLTADGEREKAEIEAAKK